MSKKYRGIAMADEDFDRIVAESKDKLLAIPESGRTEWFKELLQANPSFDNRAAQAEIIALRAANPQVHEYEEQTDDHQ